jgi:FtsH-binding integral membrane protein
MTFRSKIDSWLAIVLLASAAAALLAAYLTASRTTGIGLLGPALLAGIGAGLPLWLLFSTIYSINGGILLVRSGPFSWKIPLSEITRIVPTRSALSSPALSLDRLRVEYGSRNAVLVSPRDQATFIRAISEAKSAA